MSGIAPIQMPMLAQLGHASGPLGVEGAGVVTGPDKSAAEDLAAHFTKALSDARDLDQTAVQSAEKFASGDPAMGIHEVMIASEKANIAVRYATTLKNKALEAYRELMNTQV